MHVEFLYNKPKNGNEGERTFPLEVVADPEVESREDSVLFMTHAPCDDEFIFIQVALVLIAPISSIVRNTNLVTPFCDAYKIAESYLLTVYRLYAKVAFTKKQ